MHRYRFLIASIICFALALLCASGLSGSIYYVDTAADAGGDGTTQVLTGAHCAWDTIADVNAASFSAGDSVLFKRGCTWREQLTVPSSGSAGSVITFGAYGTGDDPIISGADLVSTWTAASGTENVGNEQTNANSTRAANYIYYYKVTTSSAGTLASFKIYTTLAASLRVKAALYTDNDDKAGSLIANTSSAELSSVTQNEWQTLSVTNGATLSASTIYWIAIWTDAQISGMRKLSPAGPLNCDFDSQVYGAWPGTAAKDGTIDDGTGVYIVLSGIAIPNVWKATCNTEPEQVFFDSTRGTEESSATGCDDTHEWYWDSNVLYVYNTSDPDAAFTNPGIEAGARDYCIVGNNKDYITIENIGVQYANVNNICFLNGSCNNTIQDCMISYAYRHGINAYGTSNNYTVDSNTITYNGASGIAIGTDGTWTISNNTISYNCLITDADGEHTYTGGIYGGAGGPLEAVIIENNTFSNNGALNQAGSGGRAIWLDGDAGTLGFQSPESPSIIRYNILDTNRAGIMLENASYVEVYYNLISNCLNDASEGMTGAGININRDCHSNLVENNVFYANRINIGLAGDDPEEADNMTGNIVRNNVAVNGTGAAGMQLVARFGAENDGTYGSGNVYEYNCFGAEATNFIEWGYDNFYSTYDGWETAYGSSTHSVESDPLMTDPASGDFSLQPTSPCINAGTDVGLTEDYEGKKMPSGPRPDIGAYERFISKAWLLGIIR